MWELERITKIPFVNKIEIDCGFGGLEITVKFSTGGCVCICGEKDLKKALNKAYEKALHNQPVIR